jgi:hypothetical protein
VPSPLRSNMVGTLSAGAGPQWAGALVVIFLPLPRAGAGIGITPLMSMLRYMRDRADPRRVGVRVDQAHSPGWRSIQG